MFLDIDGARTFIFEAIEHYVPLNAPSWFIDYLDLDLYPRLGENYAPVTLDEVMVLQRFKDSVGWKPTHYVVNDVYKLFDRLGRSTDGLVSY